MTRTVTRQPPQGQVSFTGRLVRAGRALENATAYRLESPRAGVWMPLTYVVAGPGVNLEGHVGSVVELWGTGHYRGDLRGNLLQAMTVIPQP